MTRLLTVKSRGGFDNFIKISSTLRRKRFLVDRLEMNYIDQGRISIEIALNGNDQEMQQAVRYMRKNEDVYEITQKMEE